MPDIDVNTIQLHYELHGRGDPLLFIHGLGSSSRDWASQIAYFAPRYRVIAVDLRGHGRSEKPPGPYSIPQFADDLARLLVAMDVHGAHVVGLSLGGMVAFQLALDHPQTVRSLCIVNSAPAVVPRTLRQRLQFKQREWIVRFLGMRRMGTVLARRLLPEPQQRQMHETFIERWAGNDRAAYLAALRAIVGWSVLDRIGDLRLPVLVVSADRDYTTPQQKQAWLKLLPDARLEVINNSRHLTPLDQAQAFNAALDRFLLAAGADPR